MGKGRRGNGEWKIRGEGKGKGYREGKGKGLDRKGKGGRGRHSPKQKFTTILLAFTLLM